MTDDAAITGGVKQNLDYNQKYTLKDPDHDEIKDGYQLRWVGKNYAKLQENLRPETVIVPDSEHNAKPEYKNSQNLFLTGDNLEVLKHLEHSYTGQVDMIYIDPPYNTGSDGFVYADNFHFTDEQLRDTLGLTEDEVKKIRNLYGKASHSAWLTFMYPRLKLAKKLLKENGVIFVSIDDNEQANLKLLMDEIFNEGSFVGEFIWKSRQNKDNRNITGVSVDHEYVTAYIRVPQRAMKGEERKDSQYSNPDNDPRGPWASGNMVGLLPETLRPNCHFDLINPSTGINYGKPRMGWRYDKVTMSRLIKEDRVLWPKDQSGRPRRKVFLNELSEILPGFSSILGDGLYTRNGTSEVEELFDGARVFDFPKPSLLIAELISQAVEPEGVILDFFAGSGTTAHAVMRLNQEDSGNRHYIMCTLDEPVNLNSEAKNAGYKTVDEIARERIIRASKQLKDTSGFRHYRFAAPKEKTLEQIESFDPNQAQIVAEDMIAPFSEKSLTGNGSSNGVSTILTTWLVDDGYDFNTNAEVLDLAGYKAYYAPDIARLYLIEKDGWGKEPCKKLLNKLGKNEIHVNTIIVYAYSLGFVDLTELKNNIKANLDGKPQIIERY